MAVHVSTDSVPVADRADFFADAMAQVTYPHAFGFPEGARPFSATIATSRLGPLQMSRVSTQPYRGSRTRRVLARDSEELVLIALRRRGKATVMSPAGRGTIRPLPGDLSIFTSSSLYQIEHRRRFEALMFKLPRRVLPVPDADLHRLSGTAVAGTAGLGRLMSSFLTRLVDTFDSYPAESGEEVARTVTDLFAVLAAERLGHDRIETDTAQRVLFLQFRYFINSNLADPDLSAESIARAHHVSTRYVQKLFHTQGTTAGRWILRRRLEECRRELERRSAYAPSVGEIAKRWGFSTSAHFSHAFRAAYGISPREWRAIIGSLAAGTSAAPGIQNPW
jgi:AraC-like DNA-binding protein